MHNDKKVNNGEEIDMVDSGNGAAYLTHRPEEETVMLLSNDNDRRLPNSNKCNHKQIRNDNDDNGSRVPNDNRNNCDKLRETNATKRNEISGVNNGSNNENMGQTVTKSDGDDLFGDDLDEDPYAELQSYLEKVKVSNVFFLCVFFLVIRFFLSLILCVCGKMRVKT